MYYEILPANFKEHMTVLLPLLVGYMCFRTWEEYDNWILYGETFG